MMDILSLPPLGAFLLCLCRVLYWASRRPGVGGLPIGVREEGSWRAGLPVIFT